MENLYLIIHHSGVAGKNNLDAIRNDHKTRKDKSGKIKWGRTYYNIFIDKDGQSYKEHDELNWRGKGKRSIDICVIGDFTKENPIEEQLRTLQSKIKNYEETHKFTKTLPHSWAVKLGLVSFGSICPGNLWDIYVNQAKDNKNMYGSLIKGHPDPTKIFFVRKGVRHHILSSEFLSAVWTWEDVRSISRSKWDKLKEGEPV